MHEKGLESPNLGLFNFLGTFILKIKKRLKIEISAILIDLKFPELVEEIKILVNYQEKPN